MYAHGPLEFFANDDVYSKDTKKSKKEFKHQEDEEGRLAPYKPRFPIVKKVGPCTIEERR